MLTSPRIDHAERVKQFRAGESHYPISYTIVILYINSFYCKFNIFLIKIIEMSIKRTEFTQSKEGLCKGCMLFYGSEAYQGLCSSCHKKNQNQKKEEIVAKVVEPEKASVTPCRKDTSDTVEEIIQQPAQKDRKRCFNCNKKLGLLGIQCRCGFVYCNGHRLPEDHACLYNHVEDGKKKLQKQVFKVYNGKIAEI